MSLTDLSLYLTDVNNAGILTTARNLASAAPAAESSITNKTGTSTGWGELRAQGNAAAWAAAAAAPDPSGYGFVWDVTTLEAQRFPVGLWRPKVKLVTTDGNVTCDVHVRLFKLASGGSYELIADAVAAGIVLAAGAAQVVTPTAIQGYQMDLGVGEKFYCDILLNIATNTSANVAATTSVYENGGANEVVQTPGYDATPTIASKTVLELCSAAARKLNLLYQGQTLSASDGAVLLEALNALIDRWNAERTVLYAMKYKRYTLTGGKPSYAIGIGAADWNEARPVLIPKDGATIVIAGLVHPIKVYTQPEWTQLRETTNAQVCPEGLYCDYNWPISTIRFNGVATCASTTYLDLWSWQGLSQYAALTDSVDLPPAYYEALVFNLAVSAAPEFDRQPSQVVAEKAADSKAAISQFNATQIPGLLEALAAQQAAQQQQAK